VRALVRGPVLVALSALVLLSLHARGDAARPVRLFLLSGQSNMARMDESAVLQPELEKAFPCDDVVVVKHAKGGKPIRRWYKAWRAPEGTNVEASPEPHGDLYDRLLKEMRGAVAGRRLASVVLIWSQGEHDAREGLSASYAESLQGLVAQLRNDLGRKDVGVVLARLSDHGLKKPHWRAIREAQMQLAQTDPLVKWVDADDLNGPDDELHYSAEGYATLSARLAKEAIQLVRVADPGALSSADQCGAAANTANTAPQEAAKAERAERSDGC
jgi:Carbohydrate esterase, sialic acid-specific acetylesterase